MVTNDPGASIGHRASPFDLEAHWRQMEEFRLAREPKLPPLKMTPYGPDRNVIWTTYNAYLSGELVSRPNGHWPYREFYDAHFIGPLPPRNRWWEPLANYIPCLGFVFFTNYMILPDPGEIVEWIEANATKPVELRYTYEVEGVRKRKSGDRHWTFTPNGDSRDNRRFAKKVSMLFNWLETEQAFSVWFHFDEDKARGIDFKTRFPWRYKE